MADDLKYGYKGAEPTQSFGNNTGVFDPNDINNLIANNQWTTFGQLELIETKDITVMTANIDFTDIKENIYNVHFITANDVTSNTTGRHMVKQFSTDGGSTFVSSGYQYAQQYGTGAGSFGETKSTSASFLGYWTASISPLSNQTAQAYSYFYNLGDSTKYSFTTFQSSAWYSTGPNYQMIFGSAVYPSANVVNAIRLKSDSTSSFTGQFSLYGIRYS